MLFQNRLEWVVYKILQRIKYTHIAYILEKVTLKSVMVSYDNCTFKDLPATKGGTTILKVGGGQCIGRWGSIQ